MGIPKTPARAGALAEPVRSAKLRTLRWSGGKRGGLSDWIRSLLPQERGTVYCEPFFGMGGVFFRRDRVRCEIVNDLNGRVANWWKAVRDHGPELDRLVSASPCSRAEYQWATAHLDDMELAPVERARAFYTVVNFSLNSSDQAPRFGYSTVAGPPGCWKPGRLQALSERLINVVVENMDALDLLGRLAPKRDAVIYLDPPFPATDCAMYRHPQVDVDCLTDLLWAQAGRVAISGVGDNWDHLGAQWQRHERVTVRRNRAVRNRSGVKAGQRIDVLWTNYDVKTMARL